MTGLQQVEGPGDIVLSKVLEFPCRYDVRRNKLLPLVRCVRFKACPDLTLILLHFCQTSSPSGGVSKRPRDMLYFPNSLMLVADCTPCLLTFVVSEHPVRESQPAAPITDANELRCYQNLTA